MRRNYSNPGRIDLVAIAPGHKPDRFKILAAVLALMLYMLGGAAALAALSCLLFAGH